MQKETEKQSGKKETQKGDDKKGESLLAITVKKDENFSEW
jgi:hypothetical protein